jgi:hypothetical protein
VHAPVVEGHHRDRDPAGYWSRWQKSATTMAPRGRVIATALIVTWLIAGFFFEFMLVWACQLFILSFVLKGVWAKGWAVPSAPNAPLPALSPEERRSLVPRYADWRDSSKRTKVLLIGGIVLAAGFAALWSTGDHIRQGVMGVMLVISIGVPVLYMLIRPL